MYYEWKEAYNTFGLDGIKYYTERTGYDIRNLKPDNERIKKKCLQRKSENA